MKKITLKLKSYQECQKMEEEKHTVGIADDMIPYFGKELELKGDLVDDGRDKYYRTEDWNWSLTWFEDEEGIFDNRYII